MWRRTSFVAVGIIIYMLHFIHPELQVLDLAAAFLAAGFEAGLATAFLEARLGCVRVLAGTGESFLEGLRGLAAEASAGMATSSLVTAATFCFSVTACQPICPVGAGCNGLPTS